MKRKLLVATLAGGLVLVPASTAAAHPGHTGCGAFGQHLAEEAQTFQPLGQLVRQLTPVNDVIAEEHAALCD
jgi:hypothetical protein